METNSVPIDFRRARKESNHFEYAPPSSSAWTVITENPSAAVLEMDCTAKDGTITLTDRTNGKTYTGTYALEAADPESKTYFVALEGEEGLAVCGNTTFYDGSAAPTFIIRFDDYVLNFTAA